MEIIPQRGENFCKALPFFSFLLHFTNHVQEILNDISMDVIWDDDAVGASYINDEASKVMIIWKMPTKKVSWL